MYFKVSSSLIELLILALLKQEDSYGYEISQTIKLISPIKESSLYPILKKLEKASYLSTYSQDHQGRRRKYYQLTPQGVEQLVFLKTEWEHYQNSINAIIEGRLKHD